MKRLFTGLVAFAMVLTLVGGVSASAKAATTAEIMAMIAQLQAQLAGMTGGSSAGYNFTVDLTVGSKGADVTALQNFLIGKGHAIAAGATGYFGSQTKAAVSAWQSASGISPAAGYFGPKSRAAVNAMASVPSTPGSTSTAGISTPGVEGTITASLNPTPGSGTKLYEGDTNKDVAGIKLEAKTSDIKVERVKVQLVGTVSGNTDSNFYNKIVKRMYVKDGSTVLGTVDLNSNTVVKDGSNYFVTFSGLNFVVAKDATKVLTIAVDAYASWDSVYDGDTWRITVPIDGVRGMDGAGVSQYSPSTTAFSRDFDAAANLVDSATLQLSLNTGSAVVGEVVATSGSDSDELDGLNLMSFDIKAEKDDVLLTDLVATVSKTGSGAATATTAYLYDGSNLVGSASVTAITGVATFSNIDLSIAKDSTKTLTLKVDVRDANGTAATLSAVVLNTGLTAENSSGDTLAAASISGSATSESQTVRNVGPVFTLLSRSITKSATPLQNNYSTSTAQADFSLKIKAMGGDIMFGTNASTSYPMVSNGTGAPARSFITYLGGAASNPAVASSTSYDVPSSGVVTSGLTNSFTLQENNEVTIPVSFLVEGRTTAGVAVSTGSYAIGLERLNWVSAGTQNSSTFMSGKTGWRTSTVSLP